MRDSAVLSRIVRSGIVAVVRAESGELLADVAQSLASGGVHAVEITFTVPKAHHVLETVADRLGDRIVLGAGTVLDSETARAAILAGARFIVSPVVKSDVIQTCHRYSAVVIPGALTPTEVLAAWEQGADVVKIFPADVGGPAYLKSLAGPLPHIRLMPTGGVHLGTAADFLRAGSVALGVGSSLVEPAAVQRRDFARIEELARQYASVVKAFREEN
jgi:2-dehydro-3-deoxyphosphogluconate aldolase/(4S)-4-hydroxy-2-oxoglutarate aldolase